MLKGVDPISTLVRLANQVNVHCCGLLLHAFQYISAATVKPAVGMYQVQLLGRCCNAISTLVTQRHRWCEARLGNDVDVLLHVAADSWSPAYRSEIAKTVMLSVIGF